MTTRKRRKAFRFTRDGILFFLGLVGIVYETVWDSGEKPTLLVLFAAMIGLPAFLRQDERHTEQTKTLSDKAEQPPDASEETPPPTKGAPPT